MSRVRSLAWAGALGLHALVLVGGILLVPAPGPDPHPVGHPVRVTLAPSVPPRPLAPPETLPSAAPPAATPDLTTAPVADAPEPATSVEPAGEPAVPAIPAVPPDQTSGSTDAAPDYPRLVRDAVASRQVYPPGARSRRQEGTVVLSFSVGPGGVLVDGPSVVRSSSYPRLDAAALEAVRAAVPFASPPAKSGPWVFELPMEFRLVTGAS